MEYQKNQRSLEKYLPKHTEKNFTMQMIVILLKTTLEVNKLFNDMNY